MFILKRTKRKLFHIHMTIVKALREKQERNYFLFYKQRETEAQARQRTSPRALHSSGAELKQGSNPQSKALPKEPNGHCQTPPSLICSPALNLKGHRLPQVGGASLCYDGWSPCCLESKPWARGPAGSLTVGDAGGGVETAAAHLPHIWGSARVENQRLRNHWKKKADWRKIRRQGPTWRGSGVESGQQGDRKNDFLKRRSSSSQRIRKIVKSARKEPRDYRDLLHLAAEEDVKASQNYHRPPWNK